MFLYFAETTEPLEQIRKTRFWDIRDALSISTLDVAKGPSGKAGHVMFYAPPGVSFKAAGYAPEHQEWINCGGWWLGWEGPDKPKPEHLERVHVVSGYNRTLNDGRDWHCPIARRWVNGEFANNLPIVRTFLNGQHGARVKSEYVSLWEWSGHVWDDFMEGRLTAADQFDVCVVCLTANYRLGPEECGVMELFDDHSVVEVIKALLDFESVSAFNDKKKEHLG